MTMSKPALLSIASLVCAALVLPACQASDKSLGEPCSVIEDDPEPDTFKTVRVINSTDAPLWLPPQPCGDSYESSPWVRFDMTVDGVPAVDVAPPCARCSATRFFCPYPDLRNCCEGDGQCAGTIRIGPGESYDLKWRTYVYPKVEIPEGCTEESCMPGAECRVGRTVKAGAEIEMRLQAVVECGADGCGECPTGQTCELSSSDACWGVETTEAKTNFELALDDSIIEMEFTD